jgi:hypothetical protein
MKVLNENSKSQFSRSVSPAMIRRKTANEKKVAELIDLAKEKQFDLVKVKVKEKIKEYSPILNWFNFELEYFDKELLIIGMVRIPGAHNAENIKKAI